MTLKRTIQSGTVFLTAKTYNEMVDAIADLQRRESGTGVKETHRYGFPDSAPVVIQIYNATANPLEGAKIVEIGDPIIEFRDEDVAAYDSSPTFEGSATDEGSDPVAVLLNDIPPGGIGPAVVLGIATAIVEMTKVSDGYAKPSGTSGELISSADPSLIKILHVPAAAQDGEWVRAKVLLGAGSGSGPSLRLFQAAAGAGSPSDPMTPEEQQSWKVVVRDGNGDLVASGDTEPVFVRQNWPVNSIVPVLSWDGINIALDRPRADEVVEIAADQLTHLTGFLADGSFVKTPLAECADGVVFSAQDPSGLISDPDGVSYDLTPAPVNPTPAPGPTPIDLPVDAARNSGTAGVTFNFEPPRVAPTPLDPHANPLADDGRVVLGYDSADAILPVYVYVRHNGQWWQGYRGDTYSGVGTLKNPPPMGMVALDGSVDVDVREIAPFSPTGSLFLLSRVLDVGQLPPAGYLALRFRGAANAWELELVDSSGTASQWVTDHKLGDLTDVMKAEILAYADPNPPTAPVPVPPTPAPPAPVEPPDGQLWVNTITKQMFVWNSAQKEWEHISADATRGRWQGFVGETATDKQSAFTDLPNLIGAGATEFHRAGASWAVLLDSPTWVPSVGDPGEWPNGLSRDLGGQILNAGDWIKIVNAGTIAAPQMEYRIVNGSNLTKPEADRIYGILPWTDDEWKQGSIVIHEGSLYRAIKDVVQGDPEPGLFTPVTIPVSLHPATGAALATIGSDAEMMAALQAHVLTNLQPGQFYEISGDYVPSSPYYFSGEQLHAGDRIVRNNNDRASGTSVQYGRKLDRGFTLMPAGQTLNAVVDDFVGTNQMRQPGFVVPPIDQTGPFETWTSSADSRNLDPTAHPAGAYVLIDASAHHGAFSIHWNGVLQTGYDGDIIMNTGHPTIPHGSLEGVGGLNNGWIHWSHGNPNRPGATEQIVDLIAPASVADDWEKLPISATGIQIVHDKVTLDGQANPAEGSAGYVLSEGRMYVRAGGVWQPVGGRAPIRLVADEAARIALRHPADMETGTIVVQQDTGWTWRYDASLKGHAFWSPWRVFSDYVSVASIAGRDALAPHLHIESLVSVGDRMFRYAANPNANQPGEEPGRWVDFGAAQIADDEADRLAMAGLPAGTIVVQADTGWTWRWDPSLSGDAYWSPWRVFSDYVSASTIGARDALAPHLHIDSLCSVGGKMYQLIANPNAGQPGEPPAIFTDFGEQVSPPGLEGVIVDDSAPSDPGTIKWATLDATLLAATKPGGYWVNTSARATVPAGVPSVAGSAVAPGDWLVAVDGDGDGVSDSIHLIHLPAGSSGRPMVQISDRAGDLPSTPQPPSYVRIAEWSFSTGNNPHAGEATLTGGQLEVHDEDASGSNQMGELTQLVSGDVLRIRLDDSNFIDLTLTADAIHRGQHTELAGTPAATGAIADGTMVTIQRVISGVIRGARDDVFFNRPDGRLWIHGGLDWEEIKLKGGTPIGSIISYASLTPPDGWLLCDGSAFDTNAYPELHQLLGSANVPDLRDQFIRGARTQNEITGFTRHDDTTRRPRHSNFTGSTNNTGTHRHNVKSSRREYRQGNDYLGGYNSGYTWANGLEGDGSGANNGETASAGAHSHSVSITGGGDSETAPKHVRLAFIICAK